MATLKTEKANTEQRRREMVRIERQMKAKMEQRMKERMGLEDAWSEMKKLWERVEGRVEGDMRTEIEGQFGKMEAAMVLERRCVEREMKREREHAEKELELLEGQQRLQAKLWVERESKAAEVKKWMDQWKKERRHAQEEKERQEKIRREEKKEWEREREGTDKAVRRERQQRTQDIKYVKELRKLEREGWEREREVREQEVKRAREQWRKEKEYVEKELDQVHMQKWSERVNLEGEIRELRRRLERKEGRVMESWEKVGGKSERWAEMDRESRVEGTSRQTLPETRSAEFVTIEDVGVNKVELKKRGAMQKLRSLVHWRKGGQSKKEIVVPSKIMMVEINLKQESPQEDRGVDTRPPPVVTKPHSAERHRPLVHYIPVELHSPPGQSTTSHTASSLPGCWNEATEGCEEAQATSSSVVFSSLPCHGTQAST